MTSADMKGYVVSYYSVCAVFVIFSLGFISAERTSLKDNIPASTESSSLCDATGGSRSSFLWSELPGFVGEQRSYPQKQLLHKLQLQNRAEGWTHVLPPRSGRTTFLFVLSPG